VSYKKKPGGSTVYYKIEGRIKLFWDSDGKPED
jgi:hypothetical protein